MKISKLPLFAAILPLAVTLSLVPARVHADTYQIYDLGGTPGGHIIVGIDNLGQVVILNENSGLFTNYLTYDHGVLVNTTSTLPISPMTMEDRAARRQASQFQQSARTAFAITDLQPLGAFSIPTGTRPESIPGLSPPSP
jgi:hypothetical protein